MTKQVDLSNFRVAYAILTQNVYRVMNLHAEDNADFDNARIERQITELEHFFQEASDRAVFDEDEYAILKQSTSVMLQWLNGARAPSLPPNSLSAQDEHREMHYTLRIPEIAQRIAWQLEPTWEYNPAENRKTLASLARTCTSFCDAALNDLFEPAAVFTLRRPIVDADWERVLYYSHRVRHFELHYEEDLRAVGDALIQTAIPGGYLLPNLVSFRVGSSKLPFAHLNLFLGPRLCEIQCNSDQTALLPVLTERFPSLLHVDLRKGYGLREKPEDETMRISTFIRSLKQVEYLSTPLIDVPALAHLGQLSSLHTLHMDSFPDTALSNLHDQGLFRHLLCVHIRPRKPTPNDWVIDFVRTWTNPTMFSFRLNFHETPTADFLDRLFDALSEQCSDHSLLEFTMANMVAAESLARGHIIPGSTLHRLTCYPHLTELFLTSVDGYDLDDAAMEELVRAWPFLTRFSLAAEWHDHRPLLTIRSLRTLAWYCPCLTDVELTFDASEVPGPPTSVHELFRHTNLTELEVAHSPISSAVDVARYLSAIFPELTRMATAKDAVHWDVDDPDNTPQDLLEIGYTRVWKEVMTILPVFNDVRAEEFRRGRQSIEM
ncbi:hypothetical protein FB45DRAFT_1090792 [Roridomyces roridus]|uniref:Uncharacterized protein n=1 Tax=Roridomyces roridus TaxID=1738132 RepID=A0AAD7BIL0_9AGAR|nr:hypothetical protein FB45DRAFT_1090792 [Roridomyces roridus]